MENQNIDELLKYKKMFDDKLEYNKKYFQEKTKLKLKRCSICNKDIKQNSYFNHLISKKHLKNEEN
jgi:hypothetical protein